MLIRRLLPWLRESCYHGYNTSCITSYTFNSVNFSSLWDLNDIGICSRCPNLYKYSLIDTILTDSWIISGWKGKDKWNNFLFHLSLSLPTGYYSSINISIMRLINSKLLHHLIKTLSAIMDVMAFVVEPIPNKVSELAFWLCLMSLGLMRFHKNPQLLNGVKETFWAETITLTLLKIIHN